MLINRFKSGASWAQGVGIIPGSIGNAVDQMAASLVINILSLAIPLTLMQVYDRIIPNHSMNTLLWLAVVCGISVILESVIRYYRAEMAAWFAARFEHLVSTSAMEKILKSSVRDFESTGLGTHLDRMNSVVVLRGFYAGQVFQALLDLPFAFLFLGAVYYLGGALVLVPAGLIAIYLLSIVYIQRQYQKAREGQVVINDRRFNYIIELLGGIHLMKSQAMEEQMLRRYERLQATNAEANMDTSYWSGIPTAMSGTFSLATMFGVITVGGMSVINGELTMGGLAASMLLAARATQPVQNVASFWIRMSNATIARQRLADIADMEDEVEADAPPFPGDIDGWVRFNHVRFRFGEEMEYIVDDVSLEIEPNNTIGILGKSSSGTTTLLSMILGRLKPEEGQVYIDDYNVSEWNVSNLSGRIEYVPQKGALFKGSVLENITMFDSAKVDAAFNAADLLGMDELVAQLAQGFDTQVDAQSANILPSGLVQRICIARALVVRPRILILDKTDSAMDADSLERLVWLLTRLRGTVTVIIVTNQPRLLRHCDHVYELFYGKLVEKDPENPENRLEDASDLFDSFDAISPNNGDAL